MCAGLDIKYTKIVFTGLAAVSCLTPTLSSQEVEVAAYLYLISLNKENAHVWRWQDNDKLLFPSDGVGSVGKSLF